MIFEHFAVNLKDALAFRNWYCKHLDLKILKEMNEPPYVNFLGDSAGRVMIEIYTRTDAPIIDYSQQEPLTFHFAFVSENAEADRDRLIVAGATLVEEVNTEDGSYLVMLRDPWGMSLQLCQRTVKFL